MSKNKTVLIIAIFFLFSLTLALAYKEEIEKTSEKIFQDYFQEKLSNEQKTELENFAKLDASEKFLKTVERKNLEDKNE